MFFPPELSPTIDDEAVEEEGAAPRHGELRDLILRQSRGQRVTPLPNKQLARMVLGQAKAIVAHPSRPLQRQWRAWTEAPWGEIDLEASLEETPDLSDSESLLVEEMVAKRFNCVAMLDTSFSMSGEKHLLSSVAVAVLLLEVPPLDTSVVAFGSEAKVIKALGKEENPIHTIHRFLEWQPKGFTNIGVGLEQGLNQIKARKHQKRSVGILVSDGRATEGDDPFEIAKKFDYLLVLHLHGPASHLDASVQLAQKGNGTCLEVENLEQLPRRLYDAIRTIARL